MKLKLVITAVLFIPLLSNAQLGQQKKTYTKEDSLRGSLNENRDWWDVLQYDIEVKPDFESRTITGKTTISFRRLKENNKSIQLDLQQPLMIDSIKIAFLEGTRSWEKISFKRDTIRNQAWFTYPRNVGYEDFFVVYYHGTPKEAKNAPWDGGWIWKKDSLGRPWMSVAVQGLGASAWYPCKDHQSDEPDQGAHLTMIVPDTLMAVANGKLTHHENVEEVDPVTAKTSKLKTYTWEVTNPINNYNIVPYIGKYVNWSEKTETEKMLTEVVDNDTIRYKALLNLDYWVLDYNLDKSKQQFQQVKPMLKCFEYWFGPYPFFEDGYKLVDAPHLGMEHQSAVAYGNRYRNGYLGRDLSGSGWGSKWDFIIVHESGHEWFGNNITAKDIADMWIHEGFTSYSETLYTEWLFGKAAADEYNYGIRKNIRNDKPVIGPYGVNEEGSGDMYYKGSNLINIIRKVINDDTLFRKLLRGMNEKFRHQTVTTSQIESYIIQQSKIDFRKTFDQYLRTTQVPQLEFYFNKDKTKVFYHWNGCIEDFNLPLVINNKRFAIGTKWQSAALNKKDLACWNRLAIEKRYYISVKEVKKP